MNTDGLSVLVVCVVLVCGGWSVPVSVGPAGSRPFTGYQVLEIHLHGMSDVGPFLHELESVHKVDVWGRPSKGVVDVMVDPEQRNDVIQFLRDRLASYRIKIADVQSLLEEHVDSAGHHRERRSLPPSAVTRRYLTFPQIQQFLQNAEENATHANVTVSSLGLTFEGRVTPYVTLRQRNSAEGNKSVVVIEAGIHAREWIAPAMALNIIYRLAFNPNDDPDIEQLLEKFDWIIVPVMNPDGYVYSHQNTSTRLWRKTRTTMYSNDPYCLGVDGNRNFGYQWSDSVYQGGNSNPCTDNFSGPRGFSEPETRNMRSLLQRLGRRTAMYLSMHSYGQFFLYPWGYDATATLEDEADMREVGQRFSEAMWQRNRWYEVGSSAKVLYAAAGASDDYARGGAGIKYAFTVELSPTDSSPHGFLLPAHHISTVVNDHWPAFKLVAQTVWNKLNQARQQNATTTDNQNNNDDDNTSLGTEDVSSTSDSDNEVDRVGRGGAAGGDDVPVRQEDDNDSGGLTQLRINGQTFFVSLNDPSMSDLLQHYIQFLDFRRRLDRQGGRRR